MTPFRRVLAYLRPYKGRVLLGFLFLWLYTILDGVSVGLLSPLFRVLFGQEGPPPNLGPLRGVVTELLAGTPPEAAKRIALLVVGILALKGFLGYLGKVLVVSARERAMRDLRVRLYEKILRLPLSTFTRERSGDLVSRFVHDIEGLKTAITDGAYIAVREALTLLAYLIVALWASWRLTLWALVLVPAGALSVAGIAGRLRRRSLKAQRALGTLGAYLSRTLQGIKVVKVFGGPKESGRFWKRAEDFRKRMTRFEYLGALGPPLTEFVVGLLGSLIFLVGVRMIFVEGTLSPDAFVVFLVAVLSMVAPFKKIAQANLLLQNGAAAAHRVEEVLALPEENRGGRRPFPGIRQGITVEDVTFSYDGVHPVLRGVTLEIPKGQVTALVGPSGAGKTTLADLVAGFYRPDEGRIYVDGIPLERFDLEDYRRHIAVVPQEVILFPGTVWENLTYGLEVSREEAMEAAKRAGADAFIRRLPQGYETPIGEFGYGLSGGQRQRIALARALLRDPELIILDEALSALDSESESQVLASLREALAGRTVLLLPIGSLPSGLRTGSG